MPEPWWWIPVACATLAVVVFLLWRPCQAAAQEARLAQARKEFHKQREWLEVKFISLAGSQAGPHGKGDAPRWSSCEFDDAVSYVRHRTTGELSAFVEVTVALEGIGHATTSATDLMSNLQAGTAVFRFEKNRWVTDGRVILNLSPSEAIRFYQDDLEMVGQEMADRAV
jgi:hypothetical protein